MTDIFITVFEVSVSVSLPVVLLLLSASFLNRRYAVKWKYWIWIFLAARLLIPFSGSDIADALPQRTVQSTPESGQGNTAYPAGTAILPGRFTVEIPAQMTAPIGGREERDGITLLGVTAYAWLAGALAFMSIHLASYFYYKSLVVKKGKAIKEGRVLRRVSDIRRELGMKGRLRVLEYPDAASPMMIGFLKPILILPKERYSGEELSYILKHELVHLKRGDVCAKFLFMAANAVHWFNPLIWLMQKEASVDMELSCDEHVVRGADYAGRKAYTEALLSTLHKGSEKRCVLSTQFYGGKQIMKKRFKNILMKSRKKNGAAVLVCAVAITVCAGMLTGCSLPRKYPRTDRFTGIYPGMGAAPSPSTGRNG